MLIRIYEAGWRDTFNKFDPVPNHKTDTNNHGPFSTDNIGYNYEYPEASYERRREIIKEHETYQKGWLYFHCTDPRIPKEIQDEMNTWGLPKDEFVDNGNWSHQLYIREARRMMGDYVMTENELMKKRPTPDSVGMGSYTIDSHNVQRYITPEGYVQNEGDIGVKLKAPYEIAYGSLVPKKEQCTNLLVPVCVSSTHMAFGSIRMEPVFMILGQSAATGAVMAIDGDLAVQDVPYEQLKERLLADGQILVYDGPLSDGKGTPAKELEGIVVDDDEAKLTGQWQGSRANLPYVAFGYQHDGKAADGKSTAAFTAKIPESGQYAVRISYPKNANRASNVPVTVTYSGGEKLLQLNQRETPSHDGFHEIGTFTFSAGDESTVTLSNEGTDGYVIVDAVQWEKVE